MGHPIGLPSEELADGTWVGTTPEDVQLAIGQMYQNAGILPGNRATSRVKGTSGWSYAVPSLVAFVWTSYAARRAVLVPVEADTLPVSAPTGGAARTDTIYVGSNGVVKIAQGSSAPGGAVVIDRMVIPAGATNTQGATSNWDITYAIPTGASLGQLVHWDIPAGTYSGATGKDIIRHTKRFTVPTDRLVRVEISVSTQSTSSANGWSAIGVEIDGTWRRALHAAYDGREETRSAVWTAELPAGAHTLTVFTVHFAGTAFKTAPLASASEVNVWDAGVAV